MNRLAFTLLALILLPCAIVQAQLHIEHAELVRRVGPGSYTEIHFMVHNTGTSEVTVNVARTRNSLPNDKWITAVCTPLGCQSPNIDQGIPFKLGAGQSGEVLFDVTVDSTLLSSGDFQIGISIGLFGNQQLFDMNVTVDPTGSVRVTSKPSMAAVVPNPAGPQALLALGERFAGRKVGVVMMDGAGTPALRLDGEQADAAGSLRLDLSGLPGGVYTVRAVADNGVATSARLVRLP